MTKNEKQFISFVKSQCNEYGIEFRLTNSSTVMIESSYDGGIQECSGYFDGQNKILCCAKASPLFIGILAHEYCHLTQWAENCPVWEKADKIEAYEKVDMGLSGKSVKNIKRYLGACRDLELDNERRTVEIIKEFGLSLDIKEYIQKANSYVHYYNYMYYNREWCSGENSPYRIKKVWKNLPSKFNMKYSNMSYKTKKIFDKAYKTIL